MALDEASTGAADAATASAAAGDGGGAAFAAPASSSRPTDAEILQQEASSDLDCKHHKCSMYSCAVAWCYLLLTFLFQFAECYQVRAADGARGRVLHLTQNAVAVGATDLRLRRLLSQLVHLAI